MESIRSNFAHLIQNGAVVQGALSSIRHKNKWSAVQINDITKVLQESVALSGYQVGFKPEDLIAKLIHTGGDIAQLLSIFDTNTISLVGRCHINIMLR